MGRVIARHVTAGWKRCALLRVTLAEVERDGGKQGVPMR